MGRRVRKPFVLQNRRCEPAEMTDPKSIKKQSIKGRWVRRTIASQEATITPISRTRNHHKGEHKVMSGPQGRRRLELRDLLWSPKSGPADNYKGGRIRFEIRVCWMRTGIMLLSCVLKYMWLWGFYSVGHIFVYVYIDHRNQQLELMLLLKKCKTVQWNKYNINIYIYLIVNNCQAPTWTSVRLQPQEHQLCFAKTPILDLGVPTPKDFNPVQFWGSNLFGIHWCAAALFSASTASVAPFASTASTISYSGYPYTNNSFSSLFLLFFIHTMPLSIHFLLHAGSLASSSVAIVSSDSLDCLTLRLPIPLLLLFVQVFQYSQDALYQWQALSQRRGPYS